MVGPDDLPKGEAAAIDPQTVGLDIRYKQITFEAFKQQFRDRGASEPFAEGYVDMYHC